jgi:hypothetical protein
MDGLEEVIGQEASRLVGKRVPMERADLEQEGWAAALAAAPWFDQTRGVPRLAYLRVVVRRSMGMAVSRQGATVHLPHHMLARGTAKDYADRTPLSEAVGLPSSPTPEEGALARERDMALFRWRRRVRAVLRGLVEETFEGEDRSLATRLLFAEGRPKDAAPALGIPARRAQAIRYRLVSRIGASSALARLWEEREREEGGLECR